MVAASIAAVTSKLGVAITKSTTYFHPYELARIFASLDHISRGRVAWNIVTSLTRQEAQNFGYDEPSRSRRALRAGRGVRRGPR